MKTRKHILRTIPLPVLALLLMLVLASPHRVQADGTLGAAKACDGHTLGEVNGCPACMDGENLHICENNFPDESFRNVILEYYPSTLISPAELLTINSLDCNDRRIVSLKGVEFFEKLTELDCSSNYFTSLDVSKNTALVSLKCKSNDLTSLDVSSNTSLKTLFCSYNNLTSLDLSKNTELKDTDLTWNSQHITIQIDNSYSIDLKNIVGEDSLNRIHSLTNGTYDPVSGQAILKKRLTGFDYIYDTQNPVCPELKVHVSLEMDPENIDYINLTEGETFSESTERYGQTYYFRFTPGETGYYSFPADYTVQEDERVEISLKIQTETGKSVYDNHYNSGIYELTGNQTYCVEVKIFNSWTDDNEKTTFSITAIHEYPRIVTYDTNGGEFINDKGEKLEEDYLTETILPGDYSSMRYTNLAVAYGPEVAALSETYIRKEDEKYYLKKPGYSFVTWVDVETGKIVPDTENEWCEGRSFRPDADVTLRAVWEKTVTLTFEIGDQVLYSDYTIVGGPIVRHTYSGSKTRTSFTQIYPYTYRDDIKYYLALWRIRGDNSGKLYKYGEQFIPYEDTVFEAVWKKECVLTCVSEYEGDIGENQTIEENYYHFRTVYAAMDTPVNVNYNVFRDACAYFLVTWKDKEKTEVVEAKELSPIGWRTIDTSSNEVYNPYSYTPQGDATLYAAWNLGWNRTLGRNWYYMEDNTFPVSCFKEIEGKTYYFDELGFAVTGIYEVEGKQYLFDEDGVLIGEIIPPSAEALKEAAGITGDNKDVILDVEKQEGEADPADVEKIGKEVGEDFEVVSAFDIKLFSVEYDAEGKEVGREPITQLNKPVLLTFVTPGEAGKTYQVVRIHVNEKGEVEVTLLPTTDNGDGTVSAESDKFSMFYLVEVEAKTYQPGDTNGDEKVNIFDVIRLLKKVTGEKVETFANADVNNDGKVNIFDVIRLLKYVTGEKVEVH